MSDRVPPVTRARIFWIEAGPVNVALPPGLSDAGWLRAIHAVTVPVVRAFKPDVLAVSAGFDTYKECPIAQMKLEAKTYERIGRMIAETRLDRFAVLEGGSADALPELIENFLKGFGS